MDTSYRGAMKIYKRHRNPATPLPHRGLHLVLGREGRGGEGRKGGSQESLTCYKTTYQQITAHYYNHYVPTVSYLCAWNADTAGMNWHKVILVHLHPDLQPLTFSYAIIVFPTSRGSASYARTYVCRV